MQFFCMKKRIGYRGEHPLLSVRDIVELLRIACHSRLVRICTCWRALRTTTPAPRISSDEKEPH